MQENKITVDLDDLGKLVHDGINIVMEPEAEQSLLKLLELEGRIKGAIATAKRRIEEKALEYNPNFKSVQASRVKVGYQFFGTKYKVDESQVAKPDQIVITVTAPNIHKTKADDLIIKAWLQDGFGLPDTAIDVERHAGVKGKLTPELYKATTKTSYSADAKNIDKLAQEKGRLPIGIIECERTKSITIKPLEAFSEGDDESF